MEDPGAATQDHVVLSAKVISEAGARIEFLLRTVQYLRRKGLKLVAKATDQIEIAPHLPGVLEIKTNMVVRSFTLVKVQNYGGNLLSPDTCVLDGRPGVGRRR